MSRFSVLVLLTLYGVTIAGASTNGGTSNSQFEITWQAPTNSWPEKLWIYKVAPQEYSPAVISNLLALSGFTEKDRTKVPDFIKDQAAPYSPRACLSILNPQPVRI